jgi:pyruvate carboxylase
MLYGTFLSLQEKYMTTHKLLIANRGEIAIRIARTAYELGWKTVTIFSEDDANALHIRRSDETYPLSGKGTAPYLDIEQIIQIAKQSNCQYIHPGYDFLSENVAFAQRSAEENLIFIGPKGDTIALLGDKIKARQTAKNQNVPILEGTLISTTLVEATAFFKSLKSGEKMMIKAIAGGGGRGMRIVEKIENVESAFHRCQSEAQKYFGQALEI